MNHNYGLSCGGGNRLQSRHATPFHSTAERQSSKPRHGIPSRARRLVTPTFRLCSRTSIGVVLAPPEPAGGTSKIADQLLFSSLVEARSVKEGGQRGAADRSHPLGSRSLAIDPSVTTQVSPFSRPASRENLRRLGPCLSFLRHSCGPARRHHLARFSVFDPVVPSMFSGHSTSSHRVTTFPGQRWESSTVCPVERALFRASTAETRQESVLRWTA